MSTSTLQDFIEARLRAYDPLIDLSPGSPAEEQIVNPIVARFQPDPLEMDLETFIVARLTQELPDVNIAEGTGVRDLLVKPDQILMDPVIRELQLIKQGQSLANPELLADAEADSLVANYFLSRKLGGLSSGRARLYFNAPVAINITIGNVLYTADGHRYMPTTLQSISAEAMLFNSSGSLYYFDIGVTAEAAGDDYNIAAGMLVGITNLSVAVRVTNLNAFSGGLLSEDTSTLVARAQQSITERSLVVPRGTIARLQDQFADMTQIQVVGTGDAEMQRDMITGGDLGPVLLSGNDGLAIDDGRGGTTTTKFSTLFGDFTSAFPLGAVSGGYLQINTVAYANDGSIDPYWLNEFSSVTAGFSSDDIGSILVLVKASNPANMGVFRITRLGIGTRNSVALERNSVPLDMLALTPWSGVAEDGITWLLIRGQREYSIEEVLSTTELRVAGDIPVATYNHAWSLRKKELTLSNIPGGVLFGEQANTMQSDEIHVGGCTDFYVRGAETAAQTLTLSDIVDESPLISSDTGAIYGSAHAFLFDANVDFVAMGVRPGMQLTVKKSSAGNDGTYTIVRVGADVTGNPYSTNASHWIQVDVTAPFQSGTDLVASYEIRAAVTIDLNAPKHIRGSSGTGQTARLSNVFSTTDSVDFSSISVAAGDTLSLLDGADAGDYTVRAVSGTGNRDLTLSRVTLHPAVGVHWKVFAPQTGNDAGIILPLVRVSKIDLLDGGGTPTGVTIPYADPVDARSTSFANTAHGTKISVTEAQVGIVASLDSTTYPLDACVVHLTVNESLYDITLTGATSSADIIDQINAVVPNIARILPVTSDSDHTEYLVLGSSDRYVYVDGIDGVPIGLIAGDDSRQIKASALDDIDWSDMNYDLRAGSDVVTITSVADVGNFYLVNVAADKILVVGFDESAGDVRFLTPCLGASLTVGSRSIGMARVYFLEPTSFEVRGSYRPALRNASISPANRLAMLDGVHEVLAPDEKPPTYFTVEDFDLRFIPDPGLSYTVIPTAGNAVPNNLTIGSNGTVTSERSPSGNLGKNSRDSVEQDFLVNGITVGDLIDITYQPIQGITDITSLSLEGQKLTLKIDGVAKTITFSSLAVSPAAIVKEINDAFGLTGDAVIAHAEFIDPYNYIRLEADVRIIVSSDPILSSAVSDSYLGIRVRDNKSYAADNGPYTVRSLTTITPSYDILCPNRIVVQDKNGNPPPAPPPGGQHSVQAHHFIVRRAGVQRIHATAMSLNQEFGLYYMDVELLSDGSGDVWNITDGKIFVVSGHTSDGYRLIVADPNLSYSTKEKVKLSLSNTILAVGQSDSPSQATPLAHSNLLVSYESSPLVSSIQSFASADLDRVLTASILVRHLQPAYVNFDMNYSGGSSADVVTADVDAYLANLSPNDSVESSSLQGFPKSRGATSVTNPITLLTITHDENRKIVVDRSMNSVSHGKRSTFFSGTINITKS